MLGDFDQTPLKVVQDTWKGKLGNPADFETTWRKAVHDGVVPGTKAALKSVTAKPIAALGPMPATAKPTGPGLALDLIFRPDPTIWDGRFANNGWLQELPKPITKLTWDNAALISAGTAEKLGLTPIGDDGRIIELEYQGRTLKVPALQVPGQADGTVVLHLGYGRTRAGQVGTGIGFDAYALRTSTAPSGGPGLQVRLTTEKYELASTQPTRNLEGRGHIRVAHLAQFLEDPNFAHKGEEHHEAKTESETSLTPLYPYGEEHYAWGMAIDLNSCTGCNACVTSCQAENNIPVIGKEQVIAGRLMQWMEIDTYRHGSVDAPDTYFQPRTCMHCENAPCELVCPVAATVHDAEGLNVMVYNRCVGTRYCGNNCPYKVRHFNFLSYADLVTPSLKLLNNPDVTVRSRGVMEKCTYCVQRISGARINAKEQGRKIEDGEFQTACQAACPAQAIYFGDVGNPDSQVSKIKREQRNYNMLGELNTRPRTSYLAKVRNTNPELEA
jgi:molybdopterin-containing oxidoreductase family iron-sulfur binding subunit